MEENKDNTRKCIFKISESDFFKAWKRCCKTKLRDTYEEQVEMIKHMGVNQVSFSDFCNTAFKTVPKYFESRDN